MIADQVLFIFIVSHVFFLLNYKLSGHQIRSVKLTSINSTCVISSPNPMFDHLLESSRWDDSNKWQNIGFGEEKGIIDVKKLSLSGALSYAGHHKHVQAKLAVTRTKPWQKRLSI